MIKEKKWKQVDAIHYPDINRVGVCKPSEFKPEHVELRQNKIDKIIDILRYVKHSKAFQFDGSYCLKHLLEKHINYVSNGEFITACKQLGFDMKYDTNFQTPNCIFRFGEKQVLARIKQWLEENKTNNIQTN